MESFNLDNITKLEVFNVINFMDNGYEIDYILDEGNFGTFESSEDCIEYLKGEGYLTGGENSITLEEISKKYKVSDLKEILKENGLKVSGKKQELVERVYPVLNGKASNEGLDAFGDDKGKSADYELTPKAKEFLDENQWMDIYMYSLVMFDFNDYALYHEKSDADDIQTALNFCDEVISRSLMTNNFLIFIDALSAKAHVYAYDGDYDSFLDYDIQRFILGLNPIILDAKTYANYQIISPANVINIAHVTDKFDMGNLRKRFNKIWNKSNIKNTTIPKKTSFKILQRAINGADINELNMELREKYFDKKFGLE